jgi:hypothetical protein
MPSPNKKNLTGMIFGRLTIIEENGRTSNGSVIWKCICSCKNKTIRNINSGSLLGGKTLSCGCYRKEQVAIALGKCKKKYNIYNLSGEYGIGYTTNTNEPFYFDLEDYDKIKNYCWSIDKHGYVISRSAKQNWKMIKLHSFILDLTRIDHINKNKLDNRRNNLRVATISQNAMNSKIRISNKTGIIGVCFNKINNKWISYININKEHKILGNYYDFKNAIIARLKAEKQYFGEFAPQKHLYKEYGIE